MGVEMKNEADDNKKKKSTKSQSNEEPSISEKPQQQEQLQQQQVASDSDSEYDSDYEVRTVCFSGKFLLSQETEENHEYWARSWSPVCPLRVKLSFVFFIILPSPESFPSLGFVGYYGVRYIRETESSDWLSLVQLLKVSCVWLI